MSTCSYRRRPRKRYNTRSSLRHRGIINSFNLLDFFEDIVATHELFSCDVYSDVQDNETILFRILLICQG